VSLYSHIEGEAIVPSEHFGIREADLALARRAAAGDRAALHLVVDRHARSLFRAARGLCRRLPDAEDIVQETLIEAFRAIGTFDGRASLLTWMTRILVRKAGKLSRKQKRGAALQLEEAMDSSEAQDGSTSARPPGYDDWRIDLAAVLPALTPEYREAIVLRELQGLSYAQIAATLGIAQGTVESRIYRARLDLRARLHAYRPVRQEES
jgi:RNA polymerase sigma-70 factor (ECF subfamily)